MANSVTIRTTAPGAKQVAGEMKGLRSAITGLGTKTGGPLGGMLGALGGINPVALGAGVAIGAVTGALADGIAGALAEEKQLGRLDTALDNNVKGWDGNRDAVDHAVDSMMDLAFSDDEARESMIKLITATGNVEESTRDMALAADIARGRNIDLASATDIVIKANMGNVGALRRLGIEVDKNATSTEILAELTERYGDQAEKYATSTAGKFEAAQVKVNNAMEEFGHVTIETTAGLMGFTDALGGNAEATVDYLHAVGNLVPGMNLVADAVEDEVERIGAATGTIPKDVAGALRAQHDALNDGVRALVGGTEPEWHRLGVLADQAAKDSVGNLADTLRHGKHFARDAMDDLIFAMNHPLMRAKQIAQIEGALTSAKLAEGLNSNDPAIAGAAESIREDLIDEWEKLTGRSYEEGVAAGNAYARGVANGKVPVFRTPIPGNSASSEPGHIGGGGRASGGPVSRGVAYTVGEHGQETFVPDQNGTIIPNGAGRDVHVHVHLEGDAAGLFKVIDREQGRRLSLSHSSAYSRG